MLNLPDPYLEALAGIGVLSLIGAAVGLVITGARIGRDMWRYRHG